MKISRFGAAAAALTMALGLSACGSDGGGSSSGSSDQPYIAIVSKGFQHQFWQAVKKGAEQEAKAEGARITFEGPATEQEVEAQVNMLTNALAKSPDAIGFAALDSKASAGLLEQAKSSNIPVVAFDSGVDSDIPVTTASTDNKAAAAEAAKHMAELVGQQGQGRTRRARPDQRVRHRPPRRLRGVDEGERPGHPAPPGAVRQG